MASLGRKVFVEVVTKCQQVKLNQEIGLIIPELCVHYLKGYEANYAKSHHHQILEVLYIIVSGRKKGK